MASKQLDSILGRVTTATPAMKAAGTPMAKAESASAEVVSLPTPVKEVKVEKPKAAVSKPETVKQPVEKKAEPQKSIQAFVPASVERALRMKAAEEGTTYRTLVLRGLKAIGIDVPDDELRDRRGKTS